MAATSSPERPGRRRAMYGAAPLRGYWRQPPRRARRLRHPTRPAMPGSQPVSRPPAAQVAGTAAFSKFMHLMQLVADTPEPMTVAELSKLSGYPRPTVYRTVAALLAERLLAEHPRTGRL